MYYNYIFPEQSQAIKHILKHNTEIMIIFNLLFIYLLDSHYIKVCHLVILLGSNNQKLNISKI